MFAPPTALTLSRFSNPRFAQELDCATTRSAAACSIDEVAALSTARIMEMSRAELIDVIRSVRGGHLRPGVLERLPHMDGETLRRLVFVTRRYCRNAQALAESDTVTDSVVASWR